jgi:hypothetical protein
MCRSIKVLRKPGEQATTEEIAAAALQFVRKVSGQRKPSKAAEQAFLGAVEEISSATEKLLKSLPARRAGSPPVADGDCDVNGAAAGVNGAKRGLDRGANRREDR